MVVTAKYSSPRERMRLLGLALFLAGAVALIGGIAAASDDEAMAPVVTVDSSVQDQIAALEFQIDESAVELEAATSDAEARLIQSQIDVLASNMGELCDGLDRADSAQVPKACNGASTG
jgi:hypothetical protein